MDQLDQAIESTLYEGPEFENVTNIYQICSCLKNNERPFYGSYENGEYKIIYPDLYAPSKCTAPRGDLSTEKIRKTEHLEQESETKTLELISEEIEYDTLCEYKANYYSEDEYSEDDNEYIREIQNMHILDNIQLAKPTVETGEGSSTTMQGESGNPPSNTPVYVTNITQVAHDGKQKTTIRKARMPSGKPGEHNTMKFAPQEIDEVTITDNGAFLDLDNAIDKKKVIGNWIAQCSFALAAKFNRLSYDQVHDYLASTLRGGAAKFWKAFILTKQGKEWLEKIEFSKSVEDFATPFLLAFCGETTLDTVESIATAKKNLTNLGINKIKYFEQYTNEFLQYWTSIGEPTNTQYIQDYINKLPDPWPETIQQHIAKEPLKFHTIGEAYKVIKELLKDTCIANQKAKQVKKCSVDGGFCNQLLDFPTVWGAPDKRKKKYKKKYKRSEKHSKPRRKIFRKSRTYDKRKPFDKPRFKRKTFKKRPPNIRKAVKCYACSKPGHYSNKCPGRDNMTRKAKLCLEEEERFFLSCQMEPVESEPEDTSVYSLTEISDEDPIGSSSDNSGITDESSEDERCNNLSKMIMVTNPNTNTTTEFWVRETMFICDCCYVKNDGLCFASEGGKLAYHLECLVCLYRTWTRSNEGVDLFYEEVERYEDAKTSAIKQDEEETPPVSPRRMEIQMAEDELIRQATEISLRERHISDITSSSSNPPTILISQPIVETIPEDTSMKYVCQTDNMVREAVSCISSKNTTYIDVTFSFKGYKPYVLNAYIDTGASMCMALPHAIPPDLWKKHPTGQTCRTLGMGGHKDEYTLCALNIPIIISGVEFTIPILWQVSSNEIDIMIGNDFLSTFLPG